MPWKLFLGFILLLLLELYILIKAGAYLGALTIISIVAGTALLGLYLAHRQRITTMFQIKQSLDQGTIPTESLINMLLLIIAAFLLLTPGLLTDIAGALLLIPITRASFKQWLRRQIISRYVQKVSPEPPKNIN